MAEIKKMKLSETDLEQISGGLSKEGTALVAAVAAVGATLLGIGLILACTDRRKISYSTSTTPRTTTVYKTYTYTTVPKIKPEPTAPQVVHVKVNKPPKRIRIFCK